MNPTRPEAETEYSRGSDSPGGRLAAASARRKRGAKGPSRPVALGVMAGGLAGAGLLLVAEFTPLFKVRSSAGPAIIRTVVTGSHHSYAMVPVAALVAFLSYVVWRTRSRLALLATAVLGLLALAISLIGDLPDAQASGLITSASQLTTASSSPSIGLYLETLGAIVLMITAGAGLLLLAEPQRTATRAARPRRRDGQSPDLFNE
jgi:hypothetical protein